MPKFLYDATRSTAAEHQLPGLTCRNAFIKGSLTTARTADAFRMVQDLCTIPGRWTIRIWRSAGTCEHMDIRQITVGAKHAR